MSDRRPPTADQDIRAYIESFKTGPAVNPNLTTAEHLARMRERMPRLRYLLRRLGNPQNRYAILHVGGTSGKGSTVTLLAAILQAAGHRTGLHTSPYLQSPTEKLVVNGQPASLAQLTEAVEACRSLFEEMREDSVVGRLRYSDVWVALPLVYFAQAQVDYAVIEVAMGGRYDYTNLVEPIVSAITTVDYDHLLPLGSTLPEIAWHKAGIIKLGVPAVTGVTQPELLSILREESERQAAPFFQVGKDTQYVIRQLDQNGSRFDFHGLDGDLWRDLHVSMLGAHQVANAAVAITALQAAQRYGQIDLAEPAVRAGLEQARFPGRLEIVQRRPLVLLDGAHNPEKMTSLRHALDTLFPARRCILVMGAMATKDVVPLVAPIAPLADHIITTAPHIPGKDAIDPALMAHALREQGWGSQITSEPDPLEAVEQALAWAGDDDLIVVTGSLYLVGEVRERWFPGWPF
ncbi:MAG: bifunctional folylpolyglutamate synthase/dihydrofolate synthase [Chloroflexi bacterium]|nr:bifunctional folylpolyglutamate synthase/dihydrofolate synthase [Chloroflexota bacterium]MBU1751188.1 bifunctional folylpolyglutamate synthase/dihydrofolate synthase [Chloroflexota bacterium]